MRLAAVSDLHLSTKFRSYLGFDWMNEFLDIIHFKGDVDHLLIGGDIVGTLGSPNHSTHFENMRNLLKAYDYYDGRHCTIVPGNHDVRLFGTTVLGGTGANVKFSRRFPPLFRGPTIPTGYTFPLVKLFSDVCIIALDTVSDMNWSLHYGALGDKQLDDLGELLLNSSVTNKWVILLMHHPPFNNFGGLTDTEDFWEIVDSDNVDLIVCGHEHKSWEHKKNGVPVIQVGGFIADDNECLIIDADDSGLNWHWWSAWE